MKGQNEEYMPQAPPPYPSGENVPPMQPYAPPPVGFMPPAAGFPMGHDATSQQQCQPLLGKQDPWNGPSIPNREPVGHTTIVTSPVQVVHVQPFGPHPLQIPCGHCNATVITSIKPVTGTLTWLVAGGLCLLGCWLGCCLIPFCVDGCQDTEHFCPNCKTHLGTYRRL